MLDRHDRPQQAAPARRVAWLALPALAGALAGLAAVYGMGWIGGNAVDRSCRPALDTARHLGPLARGEVAAVAVASEPRRVPDLSFTDAVGNRKTLADWRDQVVLLNLWATWCVPCRREMPALDALQAELGGARFQVVAVNIDTRDPDKPKAWLRDIGVHHLAYYADPTAKTFRDLKAAGWAFGMPTTVLVDSHGCELAVLAGPAEWASPDALALLRAAIGS
jgi:thiol-disulfide isomerase/thioredoxin